MVEANPRQGGTISPAMLDYRLKDLLANNKSSCYLTHASSSELKAWVEKELLSLLRSYTRTVAIHAYIVYSNTRTVALLFYVAIVIRHYWYQPFINLVPSKSFDHTLKAVIVSPHAHSQGHMSICYI